jgi:hypothetical protein
MTQIIIPLGLRFGYRFGFHIGDQMIGEWTVLGMHKDLTHLVLTRFNTTMDFAPTSKGLEERWLRARLELFERYCLPSMEAQIDARFTWLVFCDVRSPDWFRDRMAAYGSIMKPLYIDGSATDAAIACSVKEAALVTTPYLVTTRLDNDDAIGARHLAMVQEAFRHQKREFLVFPFGVQLFHGHLYNVYWPANPFLSLIERVQENGSFTTVLCMPHDRVRRTQAVRDLYAKPQWMQVLHEENLLNTLRGWPRLASRYPAQFHVNWPEDVERDSLLNRMSASSVALLARGLRLVEKMRKRLEDR